MAVAQTTIQWCNATWAPIRGCSLISSGCTNCYAQAQAGRFSGPGQPYEGLVRKTSKGFKWTGEVRLIEKDLDIPLHWQKPRKIFVNSMSDLWHESVPDAWIDRIFGVMAAAQVRGHIFQILTKRAERMCAYMRTAMPRIAAQVAPHFGPFPDGIHWPLRSVWLGVSCENQSTADERIPWLLKTPAAVRFLSAEPLLEALDLTPYLTEGLPDTSAGQFLPGELRTRPGLDMVIAGGESGPHARPCDLAWLRQVKDQCAAAGVACFIKQLGAKPYQRLPNPSCVIPRAYNTWDVPLRLTDRKGGMMDEWPEDLRIRQFPAGTAGSKV